MFLDFEHCLKFQNVCNTQYFVNAFCQKNAFLSKFALIRDTAKKHYIGNISSNLRSRDLKLLRLKITYFIDISL